MLRANGSASQGLMLARGVLAGRVLAVDAGFVNRLPSGLVYSSEDPR
jgi:hypothetical protein